MSIERTDEARRGYEQTIRRIHERTPTQRLVDAVRLRGPAPLHHDKVMRNHRQEWPLLWDAIDAIIKEYES